MAEQIDYRVTLDTSQLDTGLQEIRTRVSGAMGTGPSDFAGMAGGLSQFASAATAGWATMRGGLEGVGATIHTATDPGMAHSLHYGVPQLESTFWQELSARRGGPAAVAMATPPGVGAADYAAALQENWDRRITGAYAGIIGGAAPVAAGLLGGGIAGKAASALRMGGLATFGIGAAGWVAAEAIVGKGIERGNQIFQEVQELGQLATAGRGMSLAQTHEFGRGFRGMARGMGISTDELGDMIAGIRQAGMMPRTRDVKESLTQFEGMAKDIREIAVGMQTSLSNATRYLRDVERLGMGRGAGGVFSAAGMAEQLGTSLGGLINYVNQGQQMGMATGVGGAVGGQLALQSAFAGAAGMGALTGQERLMVGRATGLGRAFQANAMQNALGPWGMVQGMAMMGPTGARALPGTMMGTIEQAGQNIFGGGDPIANMVEFTTNRTRMMSQMGARGIRLMQAQGIESEAQMLMQLSPGMSADRARQFVGMNRGLNEHQARAYAAFIGRGFRDARPRGPGAAARAMPGLFGSRRAAELAIRGAQETETRALVARTAEEGKMPWTRAIDWIGRQWSEYRMDLAESNAETRRARMAQLGYIEPSEESLTAVTRMMRTGRGEDIDLEIDLAGTGTAGNQMRGIIAMAGVDTPGGGPITIGGIRKQLAALGKNIHKSTRLGTAEESRANAALLDIGYSIVNKNFNAKKIAERLGASVNQMTEGGGDASIIRQNIQSVLDQTELGKEFAKEGFQGERGAEMMAVVNRFMRGRGVGGFDIGKSMAQWSTRGMAAAAFGYEKAVRDELSQLIETDDRSIRKVAEEEALVDALMNQVSGVNANVSRDVLRRFARGDIEATGGTLVTTGMMERARKLVREEDVERNIRRVTAEGRGKAEIDVRDVAGLLKTKEARDYFKDRDTLYYAPFRRAREEVRKRKGYKKRPAITAAEARSFFTGEKLLGPVRMGTEAEIKELGKKYKGEELKRYRGRKLSDRTMTDIRRRVDKSMKRQPWFKKMTDAQRKEVITKGAESFVKKYGGKEKFLQKEKRDAFIARGAAEGKGDVAKTMLRKIDQNGKLMDTVNKITKKTPSKKKPRPKRQVAFQRQAESFQSQVTTALRKTTRVLDGLLKKSGNIQVNGENNSVDKPKRT